MWRDIIQNTWPRIIIIIIHILDVYNYNYIYIAIFFLRLKVEILIFIIIDNKSKMEKVQEIKDTSRLPRPETGEMAVQPQAGIATHKAIASLPNKCLKVMAGSGEPALSAMGTVWMVSSARPPKVSPLGGCSPSLLNDRPRDLRPTCFGRQLRGHAQVCAKPPL